MTQSGTTSDSARSLDRFFVRLYDELHRIAVGSLNRENAQRTLQPTALVHEAYLKLSRSEELECRDQRHFRRIAARVIRRVLADHASARNTAKRGGRLHRVTLVDNLAVTGESVDFATLDVALAKLAEIDEQQCRIVELRFFGGLTIEDVAEELEISVRTVSAQWATARAWLAWRVRDGDG